MTPAMTNAFDFDHIRLSDVDDSRSALPQDYYTLEINKLEPVKVTINKEGSEFKGQSVTVLKGSFTVVDSDKYSSRKVWTDFWTPYKAGQVGLSKIEKSTGVNQGNGQTIPEWASQFETLNPPARIQALVTNKTGDDGNPRNEVNPFSIKPVSN